MGDPPSPATISFRTRTVSTPARPKITDDITVATSWTPVEAPEDYPDKSAGESPSRARRSISSATPYFVIPKTFSISSSIGLFARRRKTTPRNASRPQPRADALGDVIEIGPERRSRDENNEEAERERLRDAAAQALGLGLGREGRTDGDGDGEEDDAEATPVSEQRTHPYIHKPIPRVPPRLDTSPAPQSMTSLPHPMPSPSIATTSHTSDYIPAYPSALSALVPYIQTRSALLRYHPGATFLAISLNRRTKQWRPRHVILTAPLSQPLALTQADLLSVPGQQRRSMAPQHAHLHLFKSATPDPDELEIDRLEINEDSVVFVAEHEVAGRRDVVKVGGRDARGEGVMSASASVKSVARSWHSAATSSWEQNIEEMGRTMWLLKTTDGGETQHWIKYIKTAVLVQRAERAGMTFHPNGNSSGVPSMRADLDVLLSLRSQGLLPNAASAREDTPGIPPTTNGTNASPPPNPRYAEHVGAAPSHSSPPPSFRARTYATPSNGLALPSLKGLFSASPSNTGPPTPPPDTHADIDPIAEESSSLGTRASALFNLFRSPSRASYVSPMPMQTPAPIQRVGIGSPIMPGPIVEEAARKPNAPPASFSVDWSTMQGGSGAVTSASSKHTSLSLSPPPRSRRRPWTSAGPTDTQRRREETMLNGKAVHSESADAEASSSHHDANTPTPPQSPMLSLPSPQTSRRPPSLNSTSSYASAERDRLSDLSRRTPRTVPKMLAPPIGPPPTAPSMRSHSPSLNNGAPSPVFEQDYVRRNGSGRVDQHQNSWSSPNNPYSKRVSSSSARSVNTASTGHSFLGAKSPPPPRPPPTFAPPPAPQTDQPESSSTHRNSSQVRESFLPRSLRLSLLPPAAPPTHSLPPRPDEPGYRHRRSSSSEVKSTSNLFSIPGSPSPPEVPAPPPAPPPPRGPLPPTPTPENEKDGNTARTFRTSSLNKRLRIMSTPVPPFTQTVISESEQHVRHSLDRPLGIGEPILPHPEDQPHMFLHMNDTPTTPAMTHSPSFLHVPSPLQTSADDVEPTSLSPPPRRNSRASKEIQKTPNLDRDVFLPNGSPSVEPRDSAVVIEQT